MALQSLVLGQPLFTFDSRVLCMGHENQPKRMLMKALARNSRHQFPLESNGVEPCTLGGLLVSGYGDGSKLFDKRGLRCLSEKPDCLNGNNDVSKEKLKFFQTLLKRGIIVLATVCGVLMFGCKPVVAAEGVVNALEQSIVLPRNAWPKVLPVLLIFKDHGLVLAILLALSAFFSVAETSITTLWPRKVRELAKRDSASGIFKLLQRDVTRFLTTILIGKRAVDIGATALFTKAATKIFGEGGVSTATGVMTVAILFLTEIMPKSVAVHNATKVVRFVVRPLAWLSLVLYPVGRVVTYLAMAMLKLLGLKRKSEPHVTEEELKMIIRGAKISGAIEEEEQDMIEKVLDIKQTQVREVMTPFVDVVAIDASASLIDFQKLWIEHQYSRVPVFEKSIDNITGIAYALDLLDSVHKVEVLETTTVREIPYKPVYFVPDSMSAWNLLREFRVKKVHMAVVCNEYGEIVGIVTLEDVTEELVAKIFDENDSKILAGKAEKVTAVQFTRMNSGHGASKNNEVIGKAP